MTAQEAIAVHMQWKMTFSMCIRFREPLDEELLWRIEHERDCALGKWLYSPELAGIRNQPEYATTCQWHTEFHRQMGKVAKLLGSGLFAEAEKMLDAAGEYQTVSHHLANSIMALGRAHAKK